MASRSGTSQPASILKPSRSQTRPSNSRTSREQTRQTRQTSRGGDSRGETAGSGESYDSGRTLQTGESARTGGRTGLSRRRTAGSGTRDDENVKTDDIWNKFVADDGDVIKPPTAESVKSRHTGSQRSRISGSQRGSQILEEEEEEEEDEVYEESDDDRTVYSDYYLPPEYDRDLGTPEIRAEIVDTHEACSCFPDRSSKHLGSMLYDKIVCKHTGITGETQSGVFKFNPYWNENMEIPRKLRKRDMRITKTKFIQGYPRPRFELISESEEEEDEDDEEGGDVEDEDAPKDVDERKTVTGSKSRKSERVDDSDDDDDDDDDDSEYEDDSDDDDYLPFELPQIGYAKSPSLPPSSRSGSDTDDDDDDDDDDGYSGRFPSLPPTRQLTAQTAHSKRTGVTQRTQKTQFTVPSRKADTRRSTRTAKTTKSTKSKAGKSQKADEKSLDSGYDDRGSRRSNESRQSLPQGPIVSTTRTFQGKFFDPVTKQMMLYDIGTRPGERLPVGILEPLFKPPSVQSEKPASKPSAPTGSKSGSRASNRSQKSHHSGVGTKAALVGAVFISNLLSKNKSKKQALEAGYSDEEDGNQ